MNHFPIAHRTIPLVPKNFDNPDLSLQSLFELFEEYYQSVSGEILPVKFSTFEEYFNLNLEYSFRKPRTDICNVCFNKDQQGTLKPSEEVQYRLHKKRL